MTFAAPWALWLLAALPLLFAGFLQSERRSRRLLGEFVAPRLQSTLAGNASRAGRRLRFILLLLGLAALIGALARPQLGYRLIEHKSVGRDVILALDVSRSMLANDLSPTRLARAKLAAQDLIGQFRGDRVGLVAFAGSAFLQAPLTADYAEVLATLRELDAGVIPVGGTNVAEAIQVAGDAFGKGESEHRALVLFTDGEELEADGVKAAQEAAEKMRIFTVGCGTPAGTIIAVPSDEGHTEYVKGPDGQIVKSRLDEARLREIAQATGGFYTLLQNGPPEMQQLFHQGLEKLSQEAQEAQSRREPIERYQWPLGAALLLLAASMLPGERRRGALAFTLLAWLGADSWAEAKNTGLEAYERGNYTDAQRAFELQSQQKPESAPLQFDLGTAAYKAGDFDKALDAFSRATTTEDPTLRAKAEYNLGNTLYQRGAVQKQTPAKLQEWKNSVQHYEEALKSAPKDADTTYNRDLVQRLIKELEEQQKQQQQQQQSSKDQEKQDQQKEDQQKDQQPESQGDSKKEQQPGEQQQKDEGQQQGGGEQKEGEQSGADQPGEQKEGSPQMADQKGESKEGQEGREPEDGPKPGEGDEKKDSEKKSGEIADASDPKMSEEAREQAAQQAAEQAAEEEGRQEAQAAAEGRMTPAQAEALVDSVRSQDRRVRLWSENGPQEPGAHLRDW